MNSPSQSKLLSKEEINQLIELYKQSGKTKKAFAESYGIKSMTFIDWCRKRDRKRKAEKSGTEKFIPIEVKQEPSIFAELQFNSGQKIIFYQPVPAEYFSFLFK